MAIVIQNPNIKKSRRSITDNNKNYIGIKLPLERGSDVQGYFESTTLTIDAVKENIRNLIKTRKGERVFQPDIGIGLENLVFEQMNDDFAILVKDTINESISKWMPYITINNILINDVNNISNSFNVNVEFVMNNSPTMLESVDILIK